MGVQTNGHHAHANGDVEVDMDKEMLAKLEEEESKRAKGLKLMFQQFKAMIVKKCIYAIRNRVLLSVQVGVVSLKSLHKFLIKNNYFAFL